jgi:hypothetical protein
MTAHSFNPTPFFIDNLSAPAQPRYGKNYLYIVAYSPMLPIGPADAKQTYLVPAVTTESNTIIQVLRGQCPGDIL